MGVNHNADDFGCLGDDWLRKIVRLHPADLCRVRGSQHAIVGRPALTLDEFRQYPEARRGCEYPLTELHSSYMRTYALRVAAAEQLGLFASSRLDCRAEVFARPLGGYQ